MMNMQLQVSLREALIPNLCTSTKIDVPSVDTLLTWRDFNVQPRNLNAKFAINLATSLTFAFRRMSKTSTLQVKETKGPSVKSRSLVYTRPFHKGSIRRVKLK